MLVIEEMRRVKDYGRWKARWWREKIGGRSEVSDELPGAPRLISDELAEGLTAYAEEHAVREGVRVGQLERSWDELTLQAQNVLNRVAGAGTVEVELEEEETVEVD